MGGVTHDRPYTNNKHRLGLNHQLGGGVGVGGEVNTKVGDSAYTSKELNHQFCGGGWWRWQTDDKTVQEHELVDLNQLCTVVHVGVGVEGWEGEGGQTGDRAYASKDLNHQFCGSLKHVLHLMQHAV